MEGDVGDSTECHFALHMAFSASNAPNIVPLRPANANYYNEKDNSALVELKLLGASACCLGCSVVVRGSSKKQGPPLVRARSFSLHRALPGLLLKTYVEQGLTKSGFQRRLTAAR